MRQLAVLYNQCSRLVLLQSIGLKPNSLKLFLGHAVYCETSCRRALDVKYFDSSSSRFHSSADRHCEHYKTIVIDSLSDRLSIDYRRLSVLAFVKQRKRGEVVRLEVIGASVRSLVFLYTLLRYISCNSAVGFLIA